MFCDLVGSTALSEALDPEELRDVVRAYQATCAEVIGRYEGYIAQYLGDGLLVYFGYPQAHEDDAERAVRAALAVVESVGRIAAFPQRPEPARPAVRIGIHTGLVVVGEIGSSARQEQLALGETPNLAARLQSLAAPGAVVISSATQRLVHGLFTLRDLGRHTLRGTSIATAAFQVLGESAVETHIHSARGVDLTSLIGRAEEVGLLLARWNQATEGQGQAVILCGEPGIGKSRLVQGIKDPFAQTPHHGLECRCSPFYTHTPLYPVIELLPRVFDWKREDSPEIKFDKLQKGLAQHGVVLPETLSLFASLLSLPAELCDPLPPMTPERQKRKTLEAVVELFLAMAADRPLFLIVEDLHWIDPTTLELLTLVLDQTPTARLLVLLTARPTFTSPWPARSHLTSLTVSRLSRKQAEAMIAQVAGRKALPAEVLQQITEKTDGVPLFVEQLTKMVLESGLLSERGDCYELSGPLPPLAIPSTLRDSLMARLDRLAPVKEVAQLGATLGRTFSHELIRAVSPLDDAALNQALSRLVEAELLYQRGVPPKATYSFKHALIQEAAYRSLLRSTRRRYHQRIAQALVERAREEIEARPELLGHHLTEAGLTQEAIEHWTRAGQCALQRSAILEAIVHFNKGVGLLALLPESEIRARQELALRLGLGPALLARHGYSSVEVAQAFTRAQELCEQIGDTVQLFFALVGQYFVHIVRANLPKAREVAERSLRLAEQLDDRQLLMLAHHMIGALLHWNGQFVESRRMLETAIRLHDPQVDGSLAARFGTDVSTVARAYMGWNLWVFGYAEQSAVYSAEAVDLAKNLGHAPTIAHCLVLATGLCVLRRDPAAAGEQAECVISYARAQGFAYWEACGLVYQGWALSQTGCADEGLARIQDGLARFGAMGASLSIPWALVLLAECFTAAGQLDRGLQSSVEALDAIERADTRLCEAEAHRIRGELLLEHSAANAEQAEHCFHKAIEVARSQSAKLYELRAAVSLARLWQRQAKRAEAHRMLGEIYTWFAEGFGIAELQQAKTLLDELS